MILYFSGTGNSKYLAETMANHLNDTTVDIAEHIQAGKHPTFDSDKPYVIVTPVYAWRIPRVLEQWMKACRFIRSARSTSMRNPHWPINSELSQYPHLLSSKMGRSYKQRWDIAGKPRSCPCSDAEHGM